MAESKAHQQQQHPDGDDEPGTSTREQLIALIHAILRRPSFGPVSDSVPIAAIGLDSIMVAELAGELESRFKHQIELDRLLQLSVVELADKLDRTRAPAESTGPQAEAVAPVTVAQRGTSVDHAHFAPPAAQVAFALLYFGDLTSSDGGDAYDIIVDSARLADVLGFSAVWLPERHFHAFGGVSPNPSILAAALSRLTSRIRLRAGSVILPLHHPARVAEEWAVVDNLSGGRVDLAFGTGWNVNDFLLAPDRFSERKNITFDGIDAVRSLWRGHPATNPNGVGETVSYRVFPRPVQHDVRVWLTCSGSTRGFAEAGARGLHVLTALLFQGVDELAAKIAVYRDARAHHGYDPNEGIVTVALHTFVARDAAEISRVVREPFLRYLASSVSLWRQAVASTHHLRPEQDDVTLAGALERYASDSLLGTPEVCASRVDRLRQIGVNEVASIVDFGIPRHAVLSSLTRLNEVRRMFSATVASGARGLPSEATGV